MMMASAPSPSTNPVSMRNARGGVLSNSRIHARVATAAAGNRSVTTVPEIPACAAANVAGPLNPIEVTAVAALTTARGWRVAALID